MNFKESFEVTVKLHVHILGNITLNENYEETISHMYPKFHYAKIFSFKTKSLSNTSDYMSLSKTVDLIHLLPVL